MQVKSIAKCSKGSSILQYFRPFIKVPFVITILDLSFLERPFYTGFTVLVSALNLVLLKQDLSYFENTVAEAPDQLASDEFI